MNDRSKDKNMNMIL